MRLSDPLAHVPDEQEAQLALWARALKGEVFMVTRAMKCGEEVRHFEISFSPIRDEQGELLGAAEHIRDITERQRAEDERARLLAEVASRNALLEAANKELEAFSYSVSHDLRAPLRHIDGFAGLLQRTATVKHDEKEQRYLTLITDSAKRMGRLIDDLLDFSRMGRAEMRRDTVDMDALVRAVLRDLEPDTQGRVIDWRIAPLPTVSGDASLLRQVWMNLLSNAIKYSRPRARAVIEIGSRTEHSAEIKYFVRDNGVGFEMKYSDHLFGVFQRLHRAEDFEGTGIGMANVRRIIARHGGRTWAEGQPDVGATMWFSLPKSEEKI
jgi:light-regulated signal transduction histidine kinase (bacteriophytochrome)